MKTMIPLTILAAGIFAVWSVNAAAESGHSGGNGGVRNTAISGSASNSNAGAISGSANEQVVNFNSPGTVAYSGEYKLRSTGVAPDMIASPTAPCRIGVGISGGWVGGALGIGSSVLDEGCELRENARLLNNLGKQAAAVALLCNDEKVSKVLPECVKPETLPAEPQVSYNPQTKSTRVVGGGYVH